MSSKLRLKASNVASLKAGKCLKSRPTGPTLWQRGKLPYDGITVMLEYEQSHKVKPMIIGPEPVEQLGTMDPRHQCDGRIYYLTSKYWSQLSPRSFGRPNAILDDNAVLHEIPAIERNSYRYEPLNAGINDSGHPDNIVTEFQKDADGNLTERRKMDSEKRWTVKYPAVEKKTIHIVIPARCQIVIPAYVVRQFKMMMKASKKAKAGRGRPKIHLLDEAVRLLAQNHVPVSWQVVNELVALANDDHAVTQRSVFNAFKSCGLVRMDTIKGFAVGVYGLPDLSESSMTHFAMLTKRLRGRRMTDHNDRQITAGHSFDLLAWMKTHPSKKVWDGRKNSVMLDNLPLCWPDGFKAKRSKVRTSA